MDGMPELLVRVAELDSEFGDADDVERFIEVLEQVTSTGIPPDIGTLPAVAPPDADAVVSECQLLDRLRQSRPELVAGPLRADAQYWVGVGHASPPAAARFVAASEAASPASTKPFDLGLFTSTGGAGGHGMWRRYLEINRGSSLFPLPWHTWSMRVAEGVTVREIASAAEWAALVCAHPRVEGSLLYPDWAAVARDHDAVHLTLPAIAAIQGLCLRTGMGLLAPSYWDVESTLWLHWRLTEAHPVRVDRQP